MLHISFLVLIYLVTRSDFVPFYLLTTFTQSSSFHSPTLVITNIISFSSSLFLKYNWLQQTLCWFLLYNSDSQFLYISTWSLQLSLFTICHHIKMLLNYWLHSPFCISYPELIYFALGSLYLNPTHPFFHSSHPPFSWWTSVSSLCPWLSFCSVCSFDSTCKWNHTAFVFFYLTYFT